MEKYLKLPGWKYELTRGGCGTSTMSSHSSSTPLSNQLTIPGIEGRLTSKPVGSLLHANLVVKYKLKMVKMQPIFTPAVAAEVRETTDPFSSGLITAAKASSRQARAC